MRRRLSDRLPLYGILLLGTALRLVRLGADSFWYDETVSVYLAGSPLGELIRHTAGDIHPPGYYALLRGWLLATGYPTGHADPRGIGLEFAAGFFSLACGLALVALTYAVARAIADRPAALAAAAVVAISPYNIWYSQEARMYTLAAALGLVALYALLRGTGLSGSRAPSRGHRLGPWAAYAAAAACGLYVVYYFAFLLLALNLWILILVLLRRIPRDRILPWLAANFAAVLLYSPWLPVAWRQAISPPVPPWRSATAFLAALRESWAALSLGQSAQGWLWPVLLMALALYAAGILALLKPAKPLPRMGPPSDPDRGLRENGSSGPIAASFLPVATFGPLALILLGSVVVAPLYHVRYLFAYSPAFYIVLAAGLTRLWQRWRWVAVAATAVWLVSAAATLYAFWTDPGYRPDDLRGATAYLESKWRPGDVVLVNAGYAYPGLLTYWQGPVQPLVRLSESLPAPRTDNSLVAVMTGHLDGDPNLGWGDPRSDFFAMPAAEALRNLDALFERFPRVWEYRIYDTVNDPEGRLRAAMEQTGRIFDDRPFAGEANMRVQGFVPRQGTAWQADLPAARYAPGLEVQWESLPPVSTAGETVYPVLTWRVLQHPESDISTSVRLVDSNGTVWAQPPDERPLGERFTASQWQAGQTIRQPLALPVPAGTPPGSYAIELVVYDPASSVPWPPETEDATAGAANTPGALTLGQVEVRRPEPSGPLTRTLARFGALGLIEAHTPATTVAPGGDIPVDLTWQAQQAPAEPLVIVLQLLDGEGRVVAGLESEPVDGRYPTQRWTTGEIVRDKHVLNLPENLAPGDYRLVVGAYRATDRTRLSTHTGLFGSAGYVEIKQIEVR